MNPEQLKNLEKLINQNSHTQNKEGVNKIGEMFIDILGSDLMTWERTPHSQKGDLFVGRSKNWDKSKPTILLSGHLDTVFPKNWDLHIEGDKFFGPGTMDMKAGDLVIVEALKKLEKLNQFKNIIVMFTPDEEDGMAHLEEQYKVYREADYILVYEEGSRTEQNKIEYNKRSLVYARKAVSFFEIVFEGVGGHHAKIVEKSERHSAIHEMARKIIELETLADYQKGTLVNVGLVTGGNSTNSIAEYAKINVDIRYGSKEELDRVKESISEIFVPVDENVKISHKEYLYYPSMEATQQNLDFAREVTDIGKEIGLEIIPEFRSSASEASWASDANPDAVILDGFGVVGAGDHSSEEYFFLESFQSSIDLSVKTIQHILR